MRRIKSARVEQPTTKAKWHTMNRDRIQHMVAYLILLMAACALAWFHHMARPGVVRTASMLKDLVPNPPSMRLVVDAGFLIYWVPAVILLVFCLSFKLPWLKSSVALSSLGSTLVLIALAYVWLLLTPLSLISSSDRLPAEVQTILENADRLELYSISPDLPLGHERVVERFHDHEVLGKLSITAPVQRAAVVKAVLDGIKASDGLISGCFMPRHGLRAISRQVQADLVICYECSKIESHSIWGDEEVSTTRASKALLNELLQKAGIPLAPEK